MKAISKGKIKQKYSFEAPMVPANTTTISGLDKIIHSDFNIYSIFKNHPNDYFLVRVNGESMIDLGINDEDTLIVNSKKTPINNSVVIASLNGEMLVKTLRIIDDKVYLISANKKFLPIEIFPDEQFKIHGVVEHVIHQM